MNFCRPQFPPSSYPEYLPEYLKKQQQSSSPIFLEHLASQNDAAIIDEVVEVLARSFAGRHGVRSGDGIYNWAIGQDAPADDPSCEANRVEFLRFYMKWCLVTCLEYGVVLVARDGNLSGRIIGAGCALPPGYLYASDASSFCRVHFWRIAFGIGLEQPPGVLGTEATRRMEIVGDTACRLHDPAATASVVSSAKNMPPWYVMLLGSDVDAQGRGCGTALMDAIHYLADCDGADTVLEYCADEKKRAYYCGKLGYKDFGTEVRLSDPKNMDEDDLAVPYIAAIRASRQPKMP